MVQQWALRRISLRQAEGGSLHESRSVNAGGAAGKAGVRPERAGSPPSGAAAMDCGSSLRPGCPKPTPPKKVVRIVPYAVRAPSRRPMPAQNRARTQGANRIEDYADHFFGATISASPSNLPALQPSNLLFPLRPRGIPDPKKAFPAARHWVSVRSVTCGLIIDHASPSPHPLHHPPTRPPPGATNRLKARLLTFSALPKHRRLTFQGMRRMPRVQAFSRFAHQAPRTSRPLTCTPLHPHVLRLVQRIA